MAHVDYFGTTEDSFVNPIVLLPVWLWPLFEDWKSHCHVDYHVFICWRRVILMVRLRMITHTVFVVPAWNPLQLAPEVPSTKSNDRRLHEFHPCSFVCAHLLFEHLHSRNKALRIVVQERHKTSSTSTGLPRRESSSHRSRTLTGMLMWLLFPCRLFWHHACTEC